MINMNEYWNASPLRAKSGSNIAPVCVSLSAVYSLLRPNHCVNEDTCTDGDSDAYKCVHVIVQSRRIRESAPLSQKETTHAYSSVVCLF